MACLADIVVDCAHHASLARFWAAALDGYDVAPYDDAEHVRLRAEGIDDPEDDPTVLVEANDGHPRLWFQLVPEAKVVKNRVHLDLAPRTSMGNWLGSSTSAPRWRPGQTVDGLVVLQDPEGNEFCLLRD